MQGASIEIDFRRVLDALADPVVAANRSNTIVYLNRAAEQLLQWPARELVGKSLSTIQPERFRQAHLEGFECFLRTDRGRILGRPVRVPALRRDGTEIDIELTVASLPGGGESGLVVASLRDLSERVELERQLLVTRYLRVTTDAASQLTSLLDMQHVLQTAVETLVSGFDAALARIWLYDRASNTLELQASAGLSTATLTSSRARIDVATYPYKVAEIARTRTPIFKNGLRDDPQFDQEWIAREGIDSVAGVPLLIAGELRGVLIYFARHQLHEEVVEVLRSFTSIVTSSINDAILFVREREARAEAEQAVRIRDEFLSTVSHDLKNPLAALKGRTQMLQRRVRNLPEGEMERFDEGLTSIDHIAGRMTRLINDLVDLARLRIGQPLDLQREPVDLVSLVGRVVREQQQTTERHRIRFTGQVPALWGEWDPTRLERVVANLVNNAIKYSPRGTGIDAMVREEQTGRGREAVLVVRDRGIGIPGADIPHIFDRYRRGSNIGDQIEGTGVGLAAVKQIVEQHGGAIEVISREDEGTVFTVRLPL
ncbi:MAG TPA: ATP-binding protein [Chloroflexota bacterium]|nr:ATP-binding protein [Chloroflexota bacterium]